jgi:hypothetical protein
MVGSLPGCCARAASGTVLETTIPVRKSRRRIAGSLPRDHADDGFQRSHYSRDLLQAEWGLMVNLRQKSQVADVPLWVTSGLEPMSASRPLNPPTGAQ